MKRILYPTTVLPLLLSSCGCPYFCCNTAELLAPPDARVALINGSFPKRASNTYTPTAIWTLNGRSYAEVCVQYARPHRPIIRQSEDGFESLYARRMSEAETRASFTIDTSIPAQRYLLALGRESSAPIPAERFDFRRAVKSPQTPQPLHCFLAKYDFKDNPGTQSTWRDIAQAPLQIVDMGVSLTLNTAWVTGLLVTGGAINRPVEYLCNGFQQQQPPPHRKTPSAPTVKR